MPADTISSFLLMKTRPWHLLIVFGAGLLVGAISQRHHVDPQTTVVHRTAQPVRTDSSRSEKKGVQSQEEARIQSEINGWYYPQDLASKKKLVAGVPLKDIPTALRLLRGNQGWLDHDLLSRWFEADSDAAWRWTEALAMDQYRADGLKVLLLKLAESDPMGALARALSYRQSDELIRLDGVVDLVLKYKLPKSEKPADEFLAILDSLPRNDKSKPWKMEGVSYEFPPGFDFQHFMDGLARMNENLPAVMPSGVLSSWADADPDAAQAWVLAKKSDGYGDWGVVLNTVFEKKGLEDAARWAAEKYEAADDAARLKIAGGVVIKDINGWADLDIVLEISKNLKSTTKASDFLRRVVKVEWRDLNNQQEADFKLLRSFATPAERIDVIAEMITTTPTEEYENPTDHLNGIPEHQLQLLGVTREQIQQAVSARGDGVRH